MVSSDDSSLEDERVGDSCGSIMNDSAGDDECKAIPPVPVIGSLDPIPPVPVIGSHDQANGYCTSQDVKASGALNLERNYRNLNVLVVGKSLMRNLS